MNRNAIDFTERMQTGRDLAMVARNKGLPVGKPAAGWARKRPSIDRRESELQRLEFIFEAWVHEWQYGALAAVETAIFEATP
jgi:hypothetical protein